MANLIASHGGYRELKSYQMSEIIFDFMMEFCKTYVDQKSRTKDQMEQAARSGKQNISEGSQTSGTSKQSELRLIDVARASLQELLEDYRDFLRINNFIVWAKDDSRAVEVRRLAYRQDRSYATYRTYMSGAESAANCALCIINQTNYLLDQQLRALEKELIEKGDFRERYKSAKTQEFAKQLWGSREEDLEFLKSIGLRQLQLDNGKVVGISDPGE